MSPASYRAAPPRVASSTLAHSPTTTKSVKTVTAGGPRVDGSRRYTGKLEARPSDKRRPGSERAHRGGPPWAGRQLLGATDGDFDGATVPLGVGVVVGDGVPCAFLATSS